MSHCPGYGHMIDATLGIYCHACNDARIDPDIPRHLSAFGINVKTQTKTEKSMTELVRHAIFPVNCLPTFVTAQQIEHNLQFDFSLTDESGKALEPVFGPGLTGLANLGNRYHTQPCPLSVSCYMASIIQTAFALPAFQRRYAKAQQHWKTCTQPLPAECLECQMYKLADGLLSGRYSHPRPVGSSPSASAELKTTNPIAHDSPTPVFQEGLRPMLFMALIGKCHEEFATMRQQDAEEFFSH